jgi:diguanylate cyclase (GGDEF)-like protein
MPDTGMKHRWRTRGIVLTAIAVIAAAVWLGGQAQQNASQAGAEEVARSQELLTARLDMETGLRGFLLTGDEGFLEPYRTGFTEYEEAAERALEAADTDEDRALLAQQQRLTDRWLALAEQGIEARRDGQVTAEQALESRKELMDRFRGANTRFTELSEERRAASEQDALELVVGIIVALGLSGLLVGYFVVERPAALSRRRRIDMNEFGELLQFAADEREAQDLVRRQLERTVPDSSALVMTINNSDNRLRAATDIEESTPLAARLKTATPDTCLAVRRGKQYRRKQEKEALIECEICGRTGTSSVCTPALVGGEIIGSVLVTREEAISDRAVNRIEETATLAVPVLGNLRNLAVAETRAVTDSLTGLANSRAATETLRVMAAFAGRSAQPLSAVLVDLDHFKKINDNYGHQIGDEALAAAAQAMQGSIRASDFIARYGGEEFLILLQGTDKATAAEVAEKVRRGLAFLTIPGFAGRISASFGVATIPDDSGDPDGLLRCADEALYAAKDGGRDRVEMFGESSGSVEPVGQIEGLEGHL